MVDDPAFKIALKRAGNQTRDFLNEIFLSLETVIRSKNPKSVMEDIEADNERLEEFRKKIPRKIRAPRDRIKYVEKDNREAVLKHKERETALKKLFEDLFKEKDLGEIYEMVGQSAFYESKDRTMVSKRGSMAVSSMNVASADVTATGQSFNKP